MDFDKIFDAIDHMYERNKSDDELNSLVNDFYQYAIAYTDYRVKWNFYTREERQDNDRYRTIKHDRFMAAYSKVTNYLGKLIDVSYFELGTDRKVYGDFANYVVYKLAVKQR